MKFLPAVASAVVYSIPQVQTRLLQSGYIYRPHPPGSRSMPALCARFVGAQHSTWRPFIFSSTVKPDFLKTI